MTRFLIFSISLMLVLTSCREDVETTTTSSSTPPAFVPPVVTVNATLTGSVKSESGQSLSGIAVRLDQHTIYTDAQGFYSFHNVPINTKGSHVHIEHPQHWPTARTVHAHLNGVHYSHFTLMERGQELSYQTAEGAELEIDNGINLSFAPGPLIDENGDPYHGEVMVLSRSLHAELDKVLDMLPGSLRGISSANKLRALSHYGAVAVELRSGTGPLQPDPASPVEVTFPLHPDIAGSAPSVISMWHFNQQTGYWYEEGSAQLEDGAYKTSLSHFSFWGFFDDAPPYTVQGFLQNENGNGLSNVRIDFLSTVGNISGSLSTVFSGADGFFATELPEGADVTLVASNACNFGIYAQSLGTIADELDLGNVLIPESESFSTTLSGNLVNCQGDPVSNGSAVVCWPQGCQNIVLNADGSFNISLVYCDANEIQCFFFDGETGEDLVISQSPAAIIDLEEIILCDSPAEIFLSLTVAGETRFYPFPQQFIHSASGLQELTSQDSNYTLRMRWPVGGTGTYSNQDIMFQYLEYSTDGMLELFQASCFQGECSNFSITITQYGNIGEFIEGGYQGVLHYENGFEGPLPNADISGSFRVVRSI